MPKKAKPKNRKKSVRRKAALKAKLSKARKRVSGDKKRKYG